MIFTALIESEFKILGKSVRGTEALIPEALGSCCCTRDSIFDETALSAAKAAVPNRTKTVVATITADFLRFIRGRLHKLDEESLRAETRRFELLKGLTPYLVSSEAHSTGLCDVSKYRCEFTGR